MYQKKRVRYQMISQRILTENYSSSEIKKSGQMVKQENIELQKTQDSLESDGILTFLKGSQ